jgi:hypothetical protein
MATYNKFNHFVESMSKGKYVLGTDQVVVLLTNTLPLATNVAIGDITQISYTGLSSRNVTTVSSSQTGGLYSLVLADITLTSSGTVGPFRYTVLAVPSATNFELMGWADYGSSLTLNNGEFLLVDFDPTGAITLS